MVGSHSRAGVGGCQQNPSPKSQRNRPNPKEIGPGGSWRTRKGAGDAHRLNRSIEVRGQCRVFPVCLEHEPGSTQILVGPGRYRCGRTRLCAPDAPCPILLICERVQRRVAPRTVDELAHARKPRTVPQLHETPGGVGHGFDRLRRRRTRECHERQHPHGSRGYQSTNPSHSAHHTIVKS